MQNQTNDAAFLLLGDGTVFEGKSFGAKKCSVGEAVFTTSLTGYLETLTDPSYFGQIVIQTFPLIGNYGIIPSDFESSRIHAKAYVVREACDVPSNFRSKNSLCEFLKENDVPGICGIDTRRLTKILRESGVMNAMLISGESEEAAAARSALFDSGKKENLLKKIKSYSIQNAVQSVSLDCEKIAQSPEEIFSQSAAYRAVPVRADGTKIGDAFEAMKAGRGKKVALWDFGAKANIRRELLKRGLQVVTVGAAARAEEILSLKADGVMLSNGPGDPAQNDQIIEEIKKISESGIAIFGICLGHQMLALARGAKTQKLKYGHRGANQPVKHLATGRVYISSQNHGYAVCADSLPPGATLSFVNCNDGTCEGISYSDIRAFSVQFHPEASGGPLDTNFLFDDFVRMMDDK